MKQEEVWDIIAGPWNIYRNKKLTKLEEFLADGVIVFYNLKHGNVRENAIEVLKLRGAKHQKKIVAMQVTNQGIVVYPEQEVFGEMGE